MIIVTGDSRGLGYEIVNSIKYDGLILGISRSESQYTKKLSDKLQKNYHHINFDLSNIYNYDQLFEQIKNISKQKLNIDCLINNSAIAYDDLLTNLDTNKLINMFNVNVFGNMLLSKFVIKNMIANDIKGNLIHISSISTQIGYKGLSMYAASKGAIETFSINVATEYGSLGIRSNCICPGFFESDMTKTLSEDKLKKIKNRNNLKKFVNVNDICDLVNLLNTNTSITGKRFEITC